MRSRMLVITTLSVVMCMSIELRAQSDSYFSYEMSMERDVNATGFNFNNFEHGGGLGFNSFSNLNGFGFDDFNDNDGFDIGNFDFLDVPVGNGLLLLTSLSILRLRRTLRRKE